MGRERGGVASSRKSEGSKELRVRGARRRQIRPETIDHENPVLCIRRRESMAISRTENSYQAAGSIPRIEPPTFRQRIRIAYLIHCDGDRFDIPERDVSHNCLAIRRARSYR